ncbi:MAG: AAA family ATPase [Desulfamplus sp.]
MGSLAKALRRNSYDSIISNAIYNSHDNNEKFIFIKVLGYLSRIVERYFIIDEEIMDVVAWALEKDIEVVENFLVNCVIKRKKSKRKGYGPKEKDELNQLNELFENSKNNSQQTPLRAIFAEEEIPTDRFGKPDIMELLKKIEPKYFKEFKNILLQTMENRVKNLEYNGKSDLERNIELLQQMFTLNALEVELCTFLFINEICEELDRYFIDHINCDKYAGKKYLICLLGDGDSSIYELLNGALKKSAILDRDRYGQSLSIESDVVNWLQHPADKIFSKGFYSPVQKNTTPLEYHFIDHEIVSHLLNLLNYKCGSSNHILLYGSPGSGKSSFARGLAEQLGYPAFEIMRGDDEDEDNRSSVRQSAIRACINMNSNMKPLIIVDEADNLLNTQSSWTMRGETQDKGWLNDLLDEPNLKFIWITNHIDGIETSVIRRFAYSIHFKPFNRRQRVQLWENVLQKHDSSNLVEHKDIEELARRYDVSAGAIDLAVKKAIEVTSISTKQKFLRSIQLTLDAHQTLLNQGDSIKDKDDIDSAYSLDGLNIEGDFNQVMVKVRKFDQYLKSGRKGIVNNLNILFYGPSGTGKSELARYIANTLDRSIVYKSISDIQSKWVGDSEKNIRAAFEEAEQEDAVLVFDEADSMLFNREKAQRSWEISFTNEFLNQMERFRGILICTTNLLNEMDSASMRRFTHKIGLKYLNGDGNLVFYNKMIAPLIADNLDSENKNLLKSQTTLAPGDFKVVRSSFAFYPPEELTHNECVQALVKEAGHKKRYAEGSGIGFLRKNDIK